MEKIPTIFDRDWEGNRGVINLPVVKPEDLEGAATEKLDGTNVRLTVRNHQVVRVEKRRNPTKLQKAKGIVTPWYVDASEYEASDKHILEAVKNTDLSNVPDGEWSGEAIGPKIQGNPLNLEKHQVILFSIPEIRQTLRMGYVVPTDFDSLKTRLSNYSSNVGAGNIEGIVWWKDGKPVGKIKVKDFK